MTDNHHIKTLCAASAVTTVWLGAPSTTTAAPLDMDYTTYTGFYAPVSGHAEEQVESTTKKTVKKATKKKATAKKATKKATRKKTVGLYEGADRIPRAIQGLTQKISETEFEFNFDYELDFDEETGESQVVWSILSEIVLEDRTASSIALLIPSGLLPSVEGQNWNTLFPFHSFDSIKAALDGLPVENGGGDAGGVLPLDVFANLLPALPPNFAFFSDSQLTSDIFGVWVLFNDEQSPSIMFAEADGRIDVIPEPSALFMLGAGALTLSRVRRREWCWPNPPDK